MVGKNGISCPRVKGEGGLWAMENFTRAKEGHSEHGPAIPYLLFSSLLALHLLKEFSAGHTLVICISCATSSYQVPLFPTRAPPSHAPRSLPSVRSLKAERGRYQLQPLYQQHVMSKKCTSWLSDLDLAAFLLLLAPRNIGCSSLSRANGQRRMTMGLNL